MTSRAFFALVSMAIIAYAAPALCVSPAEQQALTDLYNSMDGVAWNNNSNWLQGDACKNLWYGVGCNPSGHVIALTLHDNNLQGKFPSTLGNLYNLELLDLSSNRIIGEIPDEIGTFLHALEKLDLGHNQLEGNIPDSLGDLCENYNLIYLDLSYNYLTGFVPSFLQYSSLQYCDLEGNDFICPIPSWANFTGATCVNVSLLDVTPTCILEGEKWTVYGSRFLSSPDEIFCTLSQVNLYSQHVFICNSTATVIDDTRLLCQPCFQFTGCDLTQPSGKDYLLFNLTLNDKQGNIISTNQYVPVGEINLNCPISSQTEGNCIRGQCNPSNVLMKGSHLQCQGPCWAFVGSNGTVVSFSQIGTVTRYNPQTQTYSPGATSPYFGHASTSKLVQDPSHPDNVYLMFYTENQNVALYQYSIQLDSWSNSLSNASFYLGPLVITQDSHLYVMGKQVYRTSLTSGSISWTSFSTGCYAMDATAAAVGNIIYQIGGQDCAGVIWELNTASSTWAEFKSHVPITIWRYPTSVVNDEGQIVVVGGLDLEFQPNHQPFVFDPKYNQWSSGLPTLSSAGAFMAACFNQGNLEVAYSFNSETIVFSYDVCN